MARPQVLGLYDDVDVVLKCEDESLTQQHFANEVNIHEIIAKSQKRGLPQPEGNAICGDFSNIQDFRTAQQTLIETQNAFMALPSKTRDRFNNDPAVMLDFLMHEDNRQEAINLGLINPPPQQPQQLEIPAAAASTNSAS